MTAAPAPHRRRSMRLPGRDYAEPGAYFVTICTANRACILGEVADGNVVPGDAGRVVEAVWEGLSTIQPGSRTDQLVVMPNHIHGILWLEPDRVAADRVGARFIAPPTLGEVVRAFKARCAWEIARAWGTPGTAVWQRNYHERIVRDEAELDRIRRYIVENPFNWASDPENPVSVPVVAGRAIRGHGPVGRGAMNRAPTRQPQHPSPVR